MSYSDMFKGSTDLTGKKCFNRDTTVSLKSKTSEGMKLEAKVTGGKGLNFKAKKKYNSFNITKLALDSDGHVDFDAELNDSMGGFDLSMSTLVASKSYTKKSEKCELGFGYGGVKDLDFNMTLDLLGNPQTTLGLDACYGMGDLSFGFETTLNLPLAIGGGAGGDFGVSGTSAGLKYSAGDFSVGLACKDPAADSRQLDLHTLHKCSADTSWALSLNNVQGMLKAGAGKGPSGKVAYKTALDGQTTLTVGIDNSMNVEAKYEQSVNSTCTMTYQAAFGMGAGSPTDGKFGMGMTLNF